MSTFKGLSDPSGPVGSVKLTGSVFAWKIGTAGSVGPSVPRTDQKGGEVTQPSTSAAGHSAFDHQQSRLTPAPMPQLGSKIHRMGVVSCSARSKAPRENITRGLSANDISFGSQPVIVGVPEPWPNGKLTRPKLCFILRAS